MKKLLKEYSFNSDMQYYEMIADSFYNGQISQAIEQFNQLPKKNKAQMLKAATIGGWGSGINNSHLVVLFDNI